MIRLPRPSISGTTSAQIVSLIANLKGGSELTDFQRQQTSAWWRNALGDGLYLNHRDKLPADSRGGSSQSANNTTAKRKAALNKAKRAEIAVENDAGLSNHSRGQLPLLRDSYQVHRGQLRQGEISAQGSERLCSGLRVAYVLRWGVFLTAHAANGYPDATCAAGRCSELRVLGSIFCLAHTCQERGCDKPVTDGIYCGLHRCEYEPCRGPKAWKEDRTRGKYCSLHQCSQERCLAKVLDEQLCIDHFKALYIAKGRGELNTDARRFRRQPSHHLEAFSHRQNTDEDWHHSSGSGIRLSTDTGKPQPDRRATVRSDAGSDYDDDAQHSVISRLSHTDEEVDQW
ncbi:hypothetical protein CONLIGDRAFT_645487 [Coniochaeta ligniaria NRRL 30616]|uniref:Uncharacterized protein n=1 Tax=Coniochaeta ligniaria NRRL 30616 TaxID=1408157 RepID=A0A1J7JHU3_9PEZI|nr:hypothetical protein CONLIGDRAFT_645487 [Coniochaeta ligniaria NRRL 30616]